MDGAGQPPLLGWAAEGSTMWAKAVDGCSAKCRAPSDWIQANSSAEVHIAPERTFDGQVSFAATHAVPQSTWEVTMPNRCGYCDTNSEIVPMKW